MSSTAIFWDPQGIELDALGSKKFVGATDGDTPYVSVSIRMLSIDTPEVHYPGNAKPSKQDENLAQLAGWIEQGQAPLNADLAEFLQPRLASGRAGSLQEEQGITAAAVFKVLVDEKLTRPSSSRKRQVYLSVADQHFDQYGRLLAYMAPNYSAAERLHMSRRERATFNLLMVENGWAASFPIYPSLPRHTDLVLLQEVGQAAVENARGAWADPLTLTGYEFRMCVKLHGVAKKLVQGRKLSGSERTSWVSRYCADMTTREIHYPQSYFKVKPYNRVFIWPNDVTEAVGRLNLVPAS